MILEARMAHLQEEMKIALREGVSQGDICMYESAISEMLRINNWIVEQIRLNNRVYFEKDGRTYMLFENTTGIDFRIFAMKVNVLRNEIVTDLDEVVVANWKTGERKRLYFDAEFEEGDTLRIDANSIEYQVKTSTRWVNEGA